MLFISFFPLQIGWQERKTGGGYCKSTVLFNGFYNGILHLAGLSFDTNEPILKDAFEHYGEIIEVKVICHHVTGMSKGYGFVNFTNELVATAALKEMNGKLLDGRNIRVEYARGRRARPAM